MKIIISFFFVGNIPFGAPLSQRHFDIYFRLVWFGCFGFNGPLRQYFSLYRATSQRGIYFRVAPIDSVKDCILENCTTWPFNYFVAYTMPPVTSVIQDRAVVQVFIVHTRLCSKSYSIPECP